MSIIHFLSEGVHSNPKDELKGSFQRTMSKEFYKAGSLKGRAVCFILAPTHGVNVVAKPVFYFLLTVGNASKGAIISGILFANRIHLINLPDFKKADFSDLQKKFFKNAGGCAINAIVSPLGQTVQICKAAVGVFLPGAYFKRHEPTGDGKNEGSFYVVSCDLDWTEKKPKEALKVLAKGWNPEKELALCYKGQQLFDCDGGHRRHFISSLFENMASEMNLQNGIAEWNKKDEELYYNIGRVLKALLHSYVREPSGRWLSDSRLPIGEVFHPSYFAMLCFDYSELNLSYKHLSFKTILGVLIAATDDKDEKDHLENIRLFYEWENKGSDETATEDYLAFIEEMRAANEFELDDPIVNDSGVVTNIEAIKEQIEEQLSVHAEAKVRTLHAIARGMKPDRSSIWRQWQTREAANIQEFIQGKFDKKHLLKRKILFPFTFPQERQDAILTRLEEKTSEELKNFLRYTTGSPVTPDSNEIVFYVCRENRFRVNIYSMSVDLPSNSSIDDILQKIDFMCSGQRPAFNEL